MKILWRKVTKSNNSPDDIEQMYLNNVKHFQVASQNWLLI